MLASAAVPTRNALTLAALTAALLACSPSAPPAPAQPPAPPATSAPPPAAAEAAPPAATAGTTSSAPATAVPPPGPTAGTSAGVPPEATAGTTTAARLAAPVSAPPVEVLEAQALIPGAATPLRQGEQITVDPGATFRVVLKGTYPAARLSLLDGADAMLAGAGGREAGPSTTVTFQPAAPLKPGSAYRLRVDGATTREVVASDGTARAPVELGVLAAGEPPPEPQRKTKRQQKKRP